ncbi:MAG: hypothetical protein RLZZ399_1780 [Verrucomicrobiota bacterium]
MPLPSCIPLGLLTMSLLWPFSKVPKLEAERAHLEGLLFDLPLRPALEPAQAVGFHSRWEKTADAPLFVTLDLGESHELDSIVIVPAAPASVWGYGFPRRFKIEAFDEEEGASAPVVLLDRTETDQPVPNGPLWIDCHGVPTRSLRFTATRLSRQPDSQAGFLFCLGEIYAFSGGRNVALGSRVTFPPFGDNTSLPTWAPQNLVDGTSPLGLPIQLDHTPPDPPNNGWLSGIASSADSPTWVQIDLGREYSIEEIRAVPASTVTFTPRPGFGFPERFRIEISNTASFESAFTVVDATSRDFPNPGNHLVAWPVRKRTGRFVRFTATKLQNRWNHYVFALAELEVYSEGSNVALGAQVTCPDPSPHHSFQPAYLVDGRSGLGPLVPLETWLSGLAKRADVESKIATVEAEEASAREEDRKHWIQLAWGSLGSVFLGMSLFLWRNRLIRRREMRALRQQIARDLHDEIGSSLGSIALMSELGRQEQDLTALAQIQELASEAANSMRGIVWMIRDGTPPPLDQLEKTLRNHCAQAMRGLAWDFQSVGTPPSGTRALDFYRNLFLIFKEALHNTVRHAQASRVQVTLVWTPSLLTLRITDNGVGFDPGQDFSGSGLANMRHRALAMGATLEIQPTSPGGTEVILRAPLS